MRFCVKTVPIQYRLKKGLNDTYLHKNVQIISRIVVGKPNCNKYDFILQKYVQCMIHNFSTLSATQVGSQHTETLTGNYCNTSIVLYR